MKAVTGSEMAILDRRAIQEFGIPGLLLMERAGEGAVDTLLKSLSPNPDSKIVIVSGRGNNGGDGFVIARLLLEHGLNPLVFLVGEADQLQGDAKTNYQRLIDLQMEIPQVANETTLKTLADNLANADIIVDALLGTGIRGEVREPYRSVIDSINRSHAKKIAIDVPSGLNSDDGSISGVCVKADVTATMGLPKLGLLLSPGLDYAGELDVIPLRFPKELLSNDGTWPEVLCQQSVSPLMPKRSISAHKGTAGRLLILAGSPGLTGAAALAADSAVRAGAGLVTLGIPNSLNSILETKVTEPMTLPLPEDGNGHLVPRAIDILAPKLSQFDAIAIGPGLGRNPLTGELLRKLLELSTVPVVLDADGLYPFSTGDPIFKNTKRPTAITPHPGELSRFLDVSMDKVQGDRLGIARSCARDNGITVVLKGARTVIAEPSGRASINSTGNPAMASGGMGDVLTGVIGALLAQGLSIEAASVLGVYVHGLAADRLVERTGVKALLATQVSHEIQAAFAYI